MSSFEKIWNSYPTKETISSSCTNKQPDSNRPFTDYCAIMLSESFHRAGVDISLLKGNRCWSHGGKKHLLLAEDLAEGLRKKSPPGFGNFQKVVPGSFQSILNGKTGVVFFKDYWQRGSERFANRSGDHIDLWNKSKITSSSMLYRSVVEWFGFVSDLNKSREIWFWEVT